MLAFSTSGYVCSTGAREVFRNPLSCFMSNPWIISTGFPLTKGKQPGGVLAWKATKQCRKGVNLSEDVSQLSLLLSLALSNILSRQMSPHSSSSHKGAEFLLCSCCSSATPQLGTPSLKAQLFLISLFNPSFTPDTHFVFSFVWVRLMS